MSRESATERGAWDRVRGAVGALAPTIGTMLGGPAGTAIGGVVAAALGVQNHPTAIEKALQSDPQAAVKLAELESNLEMVRIQAERDMAVEEQRTHQAALNQSDLYTKQTRPKIARQSWGASLTYAVLTVFGQMGGSVYNANIDETTKALELAMISFDPLVFGTLAGPAVWYQGMRSIDKWKNGSS